MTGKGISSNPKVKPGKVLPPPTAKIMKLFYISNSINRIIPRTKDDVPVNLKSKKAHLQK
jgi:hypothetical protein